MGLASMRRYHGSHDVEKEAGVKEPATLESGEPVVTEPEQNLGSDSGAKKSGGRRKAASGSTAAKSDVTTSDDTAPAESK